MFKNKSYIGISFIILVFGIYAVPKIISRIQNNEVVKGDRLDKIEATKVIDEKFFGNPNFGIVSITIDPKHDTPKVLKEHAELLGVRSSNWNFLTGDREYIFDLANKGFNLYAGENSKVNGGFEHSGLFALIDKDGNIRCRKDDFGNPILYYDGLDKKGVRDIQQDINILLEE